MCIRPKVRDLGHTGAGDLPACHMSEDSRRPGPRYGPSRSTTRSRPPWQRRTPVGAGRAEGAVRRVRRCSACPHARCPGVHSKKEHIDYLHCFQKKIVHYLSPCAPRPHFALLVCRVPGLNKRRGPGRGRRTQPEPRRVCAENTNAPSSSSTARVFVVICGTPSSAAAVERVALCRSRFISGYDWRAGITHSLVRGERELPSAVASALTSIIHRPFSG